MRKPLHAMPPADALALLVRAPVVHLATTSPSGAPILRTVHPVVVDGALAFHGAPAGEKLAGLGRPAVLSAEEVVAQIPSFFVDPERACPATTYYRSVQVHGVLEPVEDAHQKAAVLQALMEKYQPEGGHVPIDAGDPLYRRAVQGLLVVRVSLDAVDGKAKLGQNRKPAELAHILERLWARGEPGDPRAIDLVRAANPAVPVPGFLASPDGTRLVCAPDEAALPEAVRLVEQAYWNQGVDPRVLQAAHRGASAWVVAQDDQGAVVATARGIGDGAKIGWVLDVGVAPAWRGRGVGSALMRLLLDHPRMRHARQVRLATKDAQGFYQSLGFIPAEQAPPWPRNPQMVLVRADLPYPSGSPS